MNTGDWNLLLNYAQRYEPQTEEQDSRHNITLIRFRQWLWENDIEVPE